MQRSGLVIAALIIATTAAASSTAAEEISAEELVERAEVASHDPAALERLKDVDVVDGRPVDLERVLAGADGNEIEERARALAAQSEADGVSLDPAALRDESKRILADDRFQATPVPRPFRGILRQIADWLEPVGDFLNAIFEPIGDFFSSIAARTPGGGQALWLIAGAVVIAVALFQAKRVIDRRTATAAKRVKLPRSARDDPKQLETLAAEAEQRGNHDLAVRLRFRAGVLRLGLAEVIPLRSSLTTGDLKRLLASPDFDRLGDDFDEIVYGGRNAGARDAQAARAGWAEIMRQKVAG